MPSFQISISPSRRVATRYISRVRRAIQKAYAEEHHSSGLTQSEIARRIGVHRSVINRELRGQKDLTLGRVAELAYALGREPFFELRTPEEHAGENVLTQDIYPLLPSHDKSSSAKSSEVNTKLTILESPKIPIPLETYTT